LPTIKKLFMCLNPTLLIIDRNENIELKKRLSKAGFNLYYTNNGNEGLLIAKKISPHIILMEIYLQDKNGLDVCNEIRSIDSLKSSFIVFYSEFSDETLQINAFNCGCDDYIIKPYPIDLLISKLNVLAGREFKKKELNNKEQVLQSQQILINKEKHLVKVNNENYTLPKKEFDLLYMLSKKPEKVFSRQEIFATVWGKKITKDEKSIDVHINKIRKKLGKEVIRTIKGIGFKYSEGIQ
jgi:two-component system, OmpR family, alkaline phosphatase synthesis response regulator PhoP